MRLDSLREILLGHGVRPRHVERLLRELRDHHADLRQEALLEGSPPERADELASQRLGDVMALAAAIIDGDPPRSLARTHPTFTFLLLPIALFALAATGTLLAAIGLYRIAHEWAGMDSADPVIARGAVVLQMVACCGAASVVAALCCEISRRCRCSFTWAVASCVIVGLLAGMSSVSLSPPLGGEGTGHVDVGLALFLNPIRALPALVLPALWRIASRCSFGNRHCPRIPVEGALR